MSTLGHAGRAAGLVAMFLLGSNASLQTAVAEGDTRTLSFHHAHTGEDITVTFKRDGKYDEAALKKLDWFMRDWRRNEDTRMDPQLYDVLWQAYREVGGREPIQVICGYRSPQTNAMLRARSSGVAQFSQHTDGRAMDFFIPGVPLEKIRNVGLRLQRGGVGFYPSSGSPFVHLDTGSIRHWPRLSHEQLAKVFPDGRTVHVPSDGQPLAQFALALADVERQGSAPAASSLDAARQAGLLDSERPAAGGARNLLASLFGFGARDTVEFEPQDSAPIVTASASRKPIATERIVPMPQARPKPVVVAALAKTEDSPTPALRGAVESKSPWPPVAAERKPDAIAAAAFAGADTIAATPVMAYAPPADAPAAKKASPMGAAVAMPRMKPRVLDQVAARAPAPIAEPPLEVAHADPPSEDMNGGGLGGPWLRALIVTPDVSRFMTATRFGTRDLGGLRGHLRAPSSSLMMTFSADRQAGPGVYHFTGEAVVFLATTSFQTRRTAALR